jgi:hypothetical protein
MPNDNWIRVDTPKSKVHAAASRPARKPRPYTQFARSGVWRFRPPETFRPFKPFRLD